MKFILNENCLHMEEPLKQDGHDVVIPPINQGYPDRWIQEQANREGRTIITCNWDDFDREEKVGEIKSAAILLRKMGDSKPETRVHAVRTLLLLEDGKWKRALEEGERLYVRIDRNQPGNIAVEPAITKRLSQKDKDELYPQRPSTNAGFKVGSRINQHKEADTKRKGFNR